MVYPKMPIPKCLGILIHNDPHPQSKNTAFSLSIEWNWIDCSKQMPTPCEQVLVWANGKVYGGYWAEGRKDIFWSMYGEPIDDVTHWMHSPDGPSTS